MELAKFAIVGFYLSINALLLTYLALKVIGVRRSAKISLGFSDNKYLGRLIRGHGNAAETMPIFFILLSLAALIDTPPIALHGLGLLFTVGRISHAIYFVREDSPLMPRFFGMLMTITAMILLALGLIAHSVVIMAGG